MISLFAGIVAVTDQSSGCDLGLLNPAQYSRKGRGLVDATVRNDDTLRRRASTR